MRHGFWRAVVLPTMPAPRAGRRDVVFVALCCILTGYASDYWHHAVGDEFSWSALASYALLFVVASAAGRIAAVLLQRRAVASSVSVVILAVCAITLPLIDVVIPEAGSDVDPDYGFGQLWNFAAPTCAFILAFMLRRWAPQASWWRRLLAAVAVPTLALWLVCKVDAWSSFYYAEYEDEAAISAQANADFDVAPEDLLAIQDELIDRQLAALLPQRPGVVDLYLLGMAGDGTENVFRNEVTLVTELFEQRFGNRGRSIELLNHIDTMSTVPMATLRNLNRSLAGLGRIIDPAEDIVFVFMTSHGSEEHEWIVQLGDLTLTQITPDDLVAAYDDAGIRWRVSVVSACYSGGYAEVLAAPTSLVITAARADRNSFGCGADADLTYFGRAYFAEAMAQTPDFVKAFEIARTHISEREKLDDFDASEPQIRSAPPIEQQLAAWRSTLRLPPQR